MFFTAIGDTIFNLPQLRFYDLLFPWIMAVGVFGFLMAWLVVSILEWIDLTRLSGICRWPFWLFWCYLAA
jgi:hypothetical protein